MSRTAVAISVLLIEDEVMISNLVADCLSESGFRVHEVVTADEALHFIKSGANVDVLFTDINLPGGMGPRCRLSAFRDATRFPKYRRWCRDRCSLPSPTTPTISAPS